MCAVARSILSSAIFAVAIHLCPEPALAQSNCGHPHGDYVVIEVKSGDRDGGLVVRAGPNNTADRLGVIPASGTGIGTANCADSGWCQVKYACISGWSYSARYLSPRTRRLYRVTGVDVSDPDGLNMRAGPHSSHPKKNSIPYNAADVINHECEPSPIDRTEWCLVTYRDASGWVAGRFLTRVTEPPPPPPPPPSQQPPPPTPPEGLTQRACKLFPNLCPVP